MQSSSRRLADITISTSGTSRPAQRPDWQTFSYNTIEGGNVPEEEVELARRTLDEHTFKQEFLASFETFSGRVFPQFGQDNIQDDIQDMGGPILWGCDFNVGVMAGVLCSRLATRFTFDEVNVKNTNTDEVCQMLQQEYPDREIVAYPDPTGIQRRTSAAGATDHGIIRQYGMRGGFTQGSVEREGPPTGHQLFDPQRQRRTAPVHPSTLQRHD